jgi:hypothetical protein
MRAVSFDHLVGTLLQKPRHVESERRGSIEVDHKLKLGWQLDRQACRFDALQNLVHDDGAPPKDIGHVGAV